MRSNRAGAALLVVLFVAPLFALLSAPPTSAAPAFCALDDPAIDDSALDVFRWTGGSGAWEDSTHWESEAEALGASEDGREPDNTMADDGYVCIDAPGDTITIVGGIEARVQAVDVSPGTTVTIVDNGKLFVYGSGDRTSYFRAEGAGRSRIELLGGILGGPGSIEVAGDLIWRNEGDGAATITTTPCIVDNPNCADLEDSGGHLTVMPSGTIDVDGNGVNLYDRYTIDIGGELRLIGDPAYIAADRGTTLHVLETGTFDIDGDGNVFEGFARGFPDGVLPTFRNDGVVLKSAGEGISAINATYEQSATGRVAVATGSLNLPDGHNAEQVNGAVRAYVQDGGSLGTASCKEETSGLCVPGSVEDDAQDAQLTIPATAEDGAEVALYEEPAPAGDPDAQPLVSVGTSDLDGAEVTLELRTYGAPANLPDKGKWRLYHGSTKDTFRQARRCSQVEEQNGVVGCVRGTETGDAVVLTIDTTEVAGWWTARGDAQVYGRPNRAINEGLGVTTVDLDEHCVTEPEDAVDWSFVSRWRTQATNDHATGWAPTGPGKARGSRVSAPDGDLAELVPARGGFQVLLSVLSGGLEGVAFLTRRESADVRWEGVASIGLADTTAVAGEPDWRLLDDAGLDFTWTKYDANGQVGDPVEATVAQLVATHSPAKSPASADDTIALGFGCAGERVLVDDLAVSGSSRADDDAWDFEADQPDVELKGGDIGSECQVSATAYPLVKKRRIALSHRGTWQVRQGQDARSNFATRLLEDTSGPTDGRTIKLTLRKKGKVLAYLKGTGKLRASSSLAIDVKVSPVIDITMAPRKVFKGQNIVVSGRFAPHDRVPYKILVAEPGTERLAVVGTVRRANAEGSFKFAIEATRLGRYAVAVQAEPTGKLSRAVSRRAVAVTVEERPDPPAPELHDFEDDAGDGEADDGYSTAPTEDNDGIEFRLGPPFLPRVGSCLWFANK